MLIDNIQGNEFRYEVYLCKPYTTIVGSTPNHEIISCLTECADINTVSKQLQNVNELEFKINKFWNDVDKTLNANFDLIKSGQIILLQSYIDDTVQSQEYMYIYECESVGVDKEIKSVKCYSKHYQWNKIKIRQFQDSDSFDAIRKIYDGQIFDAEDYTKGGILDYIIQEKLYNTWTVTYMSSSLVGKYRVFDISEQSLLDVIKTVENMFNCIFFFDTFDHTIQIKAYDELADETGLIVSGENYLKSITEQIKIDEIVTRLYVEGKGIDISGVNITGQPYLDDFTFFKSTTYMSQSLIDAINAYDALKLSYAGTYAGYQVDLTAKQLELAALQQELSDLQADKTFAENNEDSCIKFGEIDFGVLIWEGQPWSYWHNLYLDAVADITSKQAQITAKEAQITAILTNMNNLGIALDYETNYTVAQLKELLQFINEDTVKCDTEDEAELLSFGQQILDIKGTPPIEFTLDMVDIYNYASENYTWDKLVLGAIIDVEFEGLSIQSKPRVTAINHSPSGSSLSITVSNKPYFNDDLSYISSMIALTRKTSTIVGNERDTYKEYAGDKDSIIYTGNTIATGTNPVESENNVELSRRGMWMRRIRESSPTAELRILEDKILITKDDWETFATAITADGVFCSSLWVLTNEDGSVEIDGTTINITDMNLSLSANGGANTILINPTNGIEILKGADSLFYIDAEGNLQMSGFISWDYITDVPPLGDARVDQIVSGTYVGGTFINGRILYSPTVLNSRSGMTDADAPTPTAIRIWAGDSFENRAIAPFRVTDDGHVVCEDIVITSENNENVIDEFGIDPNFLDYFKNLVYNSSFEVYLQDENTGIKTPSFWSGGVCSADASFHGTHSLKLEPSETTVQNAGTHPYINPTWYESTQTRISWHSKLGEVSIRVWDRTNSGSVLSYFTLYADNLDTPLSGTSITFPSNPNWLDSRDTIYFDPNESGHEGCQSFAIEFTNDSVSEDCYIDAVQCHPDFTGKWSQLYKDGPYSATAAEIGDFTTSVTTILVDSDVRPIYVQDAEPTAPVAKDIWVDTNDYSRYDVYLAGASATLLMAGQEVVVATASGITLTLESPTQSGVVKKIKNDSNGTITVSGTIDNLSTKMLFPNESLSLVSGNSKWLIM